MSTACRSSRSRKRSTPRPAWAGLRSMFCCPLRSSSARSRASAFRDKIAASKRKGMRMGGPVPLGYDVKDKKLVINEEEAERVRTIFRRYLKLKSITKLVEDLRRRKIVTKQSRRSS